MVLFLRKMGNKLFGRHLDLRVRLFNIMAVTGLLCCPIGGITGIVIGAGIGNLLTCFILLLLSAALIWYSLVSGKYQRCYLITIIVIFFGLFPAFFFTAGGYRSGMPIFFVFAVLFTVFMLEGKKMIVLAAAQLVFYTALFIYAYSFPGHINHLNAEVDVLVDIIVCFLIVCVGLAIIVSLHFRMYIEQQRELEAARKQAEEFARMKGELFAGMSHEMRTPLAVMSAYAQFAVEQIRESGANEQTLADLSTISDEAKRLAQMADGTLRMLAVTADAMETDKRDAIPVDIGDLAERLTHLLQPIALQRSQSLTTLIQDGASVIHGNADELTQLLWNILQNAVTHSGGNIEMTVGADGGSVNITVKDDGRGIDPELLPRILEWGVSGNKGGSGIGLSICRDIARKHNGDISVQSDAGAGTCVIVTLRGKN